MAMQQVGIEFITKGEKNLISALAKADQGQQKLERSAKALESALKRQVASEEAVIAVYLSLQKAGMEYSSVMKGIEQNNKMLGQSHQAHINGLLGVDKAAKSAKSSASVFADQIKQQDAALKQAQPAMEAYNRSLLGTDKAVKSAKASADVFAADIKRQETALKQAQPAMEAYNRSLLGTDKAVKSAKASADVFKPMLDALDQDAKMAAQSAEEYNRALLGTDKAQKSAKSSADVFKAAIKANELAVEQSARATREAAAAEAAANAERQRAQQGYNQLRAAIDQNYAARMRIKQASETLRRAVEAEIITTQEAAQMLRQYGSVANTTNAYVAQTARRTNQLGVLMQQTGYQVGDFAVQVQSGTHYMVALGQQATQLVGTFAMLAQSTRMIAVFSALGILVPLVTAGAGAWMRYREAQDEAADSTENLKNELENLDNALEEWIRTKAAAASGLTVEQILGLGGLEDARRDLQAARNEVARAIETGPSIMIGGEQLAIRGLEQAKAEKAEKEAIVQVELARLRVSRIQQRLDEQRILTVSEIRQELQQEAQMAQTIARFGEESAEVSKLEAEQEKIKFAQRVAQLDITDKQKILLLEEYDATKQIVAETQNVDNAMSGVTSELSKAVNQALLLRDAMASVARASLSRQDEIAVLRSQISAARAGTSTEAARAQTETALEMSRGGATLDQIAAAATTAAEEAETIENLQEQLSVLTRPQSGTSGGGVGAGQSIAEEFERLKRSIDDAYDSSQKFKESKDVLDRAMASGVIKSTEEYNRLLGLLREEYDMTSEKGDTFADSMQKIAETARDALGDAFMSIVEGTKSASDAFKDMARAILKQAFDLLVIQPILDGLFGGLTGGGGGGIFSLFSANGNAFSGGNVIPFANGGVVGGPTTFPMSSGRVGLMGEAGPEAIMPLKRGKGGKLGVVAEGTSQPVVVNQSFNFSANGDDSVKRIIAQEAPKIANLTQKQILESRSRGGAFRTTFGT